MQYTDKASIMLLGSRHLNLMKKEIDDVISMVLGCVKIIDLRHREHGERAFDERFSTPTGLWAVTASLLLSPGSPTEVVRVTWNIEYLMRLPTVRSLRVSYVHDSSRTCDLADVQMVRASLDFFIEGMEKAFPAAADRWKPLLDAAAAAKPEPKIRKHRLLLKGVHSILGDAIESKVKEELGGVEVKSFEVEEVFEKILPNPAGHPISTVAGVTVIVEYVEL